MNPKRILQTRLIFSVIVFILMPFRQSALIRYVCVSILIHFQERFQIDAFSRGEKAQRISVDRRSKRIKFQVWTGPLCSLLVCVCYI